MPEKMTFLTLSVLSTPGKRDVEEVLNVRRVDLAKWLRTKCLEERENIFGVQPLPFPTSTSPALNFTPLNYISPVFFKIYLGLVTLDARRGRNGFYAYRYTRGQPTWRWLQFPRCNQHLHWRGDWYVLIIQAYVKPSWLAGIRRYGTWELYIHGQLHLGWCNERLWGELKCMLVSNVN